MTLRWAVLVVLLAATESSFVACATAAPIPTQVPRDSRFTLAPGAAAVVEGTSFQIRFDRVVEDSRCPTDVTCIQAGDAIVQISVIQDNGATQSYQLHTTGSHSIMHGGLTISLEELTPQPLSSRAIAASEYRATLRVSR